VTQPAPVNPPGAPPAADGIPAPPPPAEPEEILPRRFGKYTLLRKLATGGMAELYLALHRSVAGFEKLLVIKRILPTMAKDQGFITMLLQEARIAATFSHPNIVTIFDVGQADKSFFIAMEHIHGEDLRSVVRAMKPKGVTEFPLEHALAIISGVAAGLAYAHDKRDLNGNSLNIVHRDISPQNILVTFTGDVKVVDFGIAKATESTLREEIIVAPGIEIDKGKDSEHHTKAGQLKGKVPYMSPEQARGEPLDARSDVFSLGVMMFELCTGRRLFRGPNEYETIRMITEGEYPRPSQVNPRISAQLEGVILRALAKDLTKRFQTAREMQVELERVVRDERIAVSTLTLGSWMQMLFEEKLAAQREALLQGKQLADVIAAEEPDQYTGAGTEGGSMPSVQRPASKVPWIVAGIAVLAIAVGGFVYFRREHARAQQEIALRAINSGSIEVHSMPEGASIWLNNSPTQFRTPYTLRGLATGTAVRYTLRLTAEGYDPYLQEVRLPVRNARTSVQGLLVRARASSYVVLEVSTTPRGANVFVDGRQVPGTTPVTVPELAPGVEHVVLVRHPETIDETFRFVGQAGNVERRPLALRERPLGPDEAFVNLTTEPPNARVRIADREVTTGSPFHIRVRAGAPLQFSVILAGFEIERRDARPRAGQILDLGAIRLSRPPPSGGPAVVDRRPGTLRVGVRGAWCNVTIDGRSFGETPVEAHLPPGSHNVVCTNPTRGARSQRVNLPPGGNERAVFTF